MGILFFWIIGNRSICVNVKKKKGPRRKACSRFHQFVPSFMVMVSALEKDEELRHPRGPDVQLLFLCDEKLSWFGADQIRCLLDASSSPGCTRNTLEKRLWDP